MVKIFRAPFQRGRGYANMTFLRVKNYFQIDKMNYNFLLNVFIHPQEKNFFGEGITQKFDNLVLVTRKKNFSGEGLPTYDIVM